WLAAIVAEVGQPTTFCLPDRVTRFASDLETLARELASTAVKVKPPSAVACRRLLTHAVESPPYNPRIPPDELRTALERLRRELLESGPERRRVRPADPEPGIGLREPPTEQLERLVGRAEQEVTVGPRRRAAAELREDVGAGDPRAAGGPGDRGAVGEHHAGV